LIRNSSGLIFRRVESRSRALIATLYNRESDKNLYVCSVHLDADKSTDPKKREYHQKQRHSQLTSLLKRINYACKLENQIIHEAPIVIAGDFNMSRDNPLHLSLAEGSLSTSPSAHVLLYDAYMEAERKGRCSVPVYHCESSFNKSDLHLVKTYKGGAILDYIWTSEKVKVIDTLLYHPRSLTLGTEKWPCDNHPSDHLPIGIDFEWLQY